MVLAGIGEVLEEGRDGHGRVLGHDGTSSGVIGSRLGTSPQGEHQTVQLWDPAPGLEVLTLRGQKGPL